MMQRISQEEADNFIPLKEDFTGTSVDECPYFTMIPIGDGWDKVTYYTGRKRNPYRERGEGKYYIYVLSNASMPGLFKIGYTHNTPEERAKQVSAATGVVYPFVVEYAFKCHDGLLLEKEVHKYLDLYRVNNDREFFQVELDEAIKTIEFLGKSYI